MSAVKVLSIIEIVFFSLCFILIGAFAESDVEAAAGWGLFSTLYGLGFAITTLVKVKNAAA